MANESTLSTGKLLPGGLPRNSVVWINGRPDMTSAVYRGRKAQKQTKKTTTICLPMKIRTDIEVSRDSIKLGVQCKIDISSPLSQLFYHILFV